MDKFLDAYDLHKLSQQDIKHTNRSIASNKIEAVINSLPTKKSPGLDVFTAEFYQAFKVELTSMFLKLLHKMEREGTLLNSLYEVNTTLIAKPDKDRTKKKIIDQFP
jgi:hypothetical protein